MLPQIVGDYELIQTIGKGASGKVYTAKRLNSDSLVAIKQVNSTNPNVQREIKLMKMMDHPFIVPIFDVIEKDGSTYIVMEYVEGITLLEFIKQHKGNFPEWQAKHLFCEILSCLHYLHTKLGIVHRDLKLENIIVDQNMNIRLLDFGLSNYAITDHAMFMTKCGSPMYVAPEILLGNQYSYKVDIWSLGVILYGMAYNTFPFADTNMKNLAAKIAYKEPFLPMGPSKEMIDVIRMCLRKSASERPDSVELMETNWVASYSNKQLLAFDFGRKQNWLLGTDFSDPVKRIYDRVRIVQEMAILIKLAGFVRAFNSPVLPKSRTLRHAPLVMLKDSHKQKSSYATNINLRFKNCRTRVVAQSVITTV